MMKKLTLALTFAAIATSAAAQDKKVTVEDFVGTWNIELMSHQIALVVEPPDGARVTATAKSASVRSAGDSAAVRWSQTSCSASAGLLDSRPKSRACESVQ